MLYNLVASSLSPVGSHFRESICLCHTSAGIHKVLTDIGIVRTKHVRAFEDEFTSTDRLQNDACFDPEQGSITDTVSTSSSVEISTSDSCDDNTDTTDDNSHNDRAESYAVLLTRQCIQAHTVKGRAKVMTMWTVAEMVMMMVRTFT